MKKCCLPDGTQLSCLGRAITGLRSGVLEELAFLAIVNGIIALFFDSAVNLHSRRCGCW